MIKCSTSIISFILTFLSLFRLFYAVAQNNTIPVNVGMILNYDSLFGKMGLSCINMALSDFYDSHAYYKTRLVLHTRDSMRDVVVEAAAALNLIQNVEVQAIVRGPDSSMRANFVNDLGDKAQVPMISFSTTSPSLSSLRSSYEFRVAQNDSSQLRAISAIIQAFGWREAVPIYVDNEFGEGVIPYVTNALQEINARIPYWCVIPAMATDDQIAEKIQQLMTMQTRVFILHMLPSVGSRLFAKAKEFGMMDEGYVWIMTDGMANFLGSTNSSVIDNMQGVLGLKSLVPDTEELENFRVRWQMKFQKDNPTTLNVRLDVFGLWAYDAAWALAMAIERVHNTTTVKYQNVNISDSSTDLEQIRASESGPELVKALSNTIFRGLSGNFSFLNRQLQSSNFQILDGARGIGYWTPQTGLVRNLNSSSMSTYYTTSNAGSLGLVIWPGPGDTTTIPKGWQIPNHGNKLKILVPVKQGFEEFVNVTYDLITNTTIITGFCIDVFEAVMEELPYSVSYEYYPFAKLNGEPAGSYSDLIVQVSLGNYDVAVGDITNRANRSLYVDFTSPYTESGVSMVVPLKAKKSRKSALLFLKPFTWELWVITCCFFFLIAIVVWLPEHRTNDDFRGPPGHQVGTSIWFSLSTMVFAHREQLVSNLAKFVVTVWLFVVLILTQSYTASLTSILTVQQLQPTITDIEMILKNGDLVGFQEGSFVQGILIHLGFHRENLRAYRSAEELDQLFEKGSLSAALDETPFMNLFISTYCSKYAMVEPTSLKADSGFAFAFPKCSPLTLDVSRLISNLQEGEKMKAIMDKWFKKQARCTDPYNTGTSYTSPISLGGLWGLFLIAEASSGLALLVHAAILLYKNRHILIRSQLPRTIFIYLIFDQRELHSPNNVQAVGAIDPANSLPKPSDHLGCTDMNNANFEMQEILSSPDISGDLESTGSSQRPSSSHSSRTA
ncbi:LOW QUALITY PROTEIN: glutamate receptor 2.8-like [Argentina anserina]|uniref:LOW QUALITY PROTEIN: glutamate receptor 2.8-like n=1 Tax=Argentina anserina TaxID=57926 RepID=UPI002176889A|nr:LOW QUALITY PROTEIN: glutamate receptor 2.8-like [Potentilla anserina]